MALTPEDVVNKRFQPTKFREGYDQDEVDDFLDEVVTELRRLLAENDDLRTKLADCEAGRSGGQGQSGASGRLVKAAPGAAPGAAAAAGETETPERATGVLALAQRLHDEHVRSGQEQRDRLVTEAQARATDLVQTAVYEAEQQRAAAQRDAAAVAADVAAHREATYADVLGEIDRELRDGMARAAACGVAPQAIILDPGLGFAKRAEHTFEALARLDELVGEPWPRPQDVERLRAIHTQRIRRASSSVVTSGFSQRTPIPARAAASAGP